MLLVEDDAISARAMAGILRQQSLEVTIVGTVQDAIDALRKREFQFLVLDLMLPDGSGAEVLGEVRERNLDTWVCVVTAATDPSLIDGVKNMQPQSLLRKPIDMGELLGGMNLTQ